MTSTADVIIIGAGVQGIGLAFHLAKAGAGSIVVLEKKHVAAGPTAKSGAMIRPLFSQEIYIRLVLEATRAFEHWDHVYGGDPGFVQKGFFRITDTLEVDRLGGDLQLMQRLGVPFQRVPHNDLSLYSPSSEFRGDETGLLLTKSGYADPIKTTNSLAAAAIRCGVVIKEGVRVTGIEVCGGQVQAVTTDAGRIATKLIVNCAGAWSDRVAAMVGVTLPIAIHRIPTTLYHRPLRLRDEGPILSDGVNQVYVRASGDSFLRAAAFGWSHDPVDPDLYDETISRKQHDSLRTLVDRRCTAMRKTPSAGGFAAIYDMTPDAHPIVGPIGDVAGFWCNCGWSGNGFASGPIVGRHLAAQILHGESEIDLSPFAWPRVGDLTPRPDLAWVSR